MKVRLHIDYPFVEEGYMIARERRERKKENNTVPYDVYPPYEVHINDLREVRMLGHDGLILKTKDRKLCLEFDHPE